MRWRGRVSRSSRAFRAEDLQVGAEGKVSTTVPLEPDSTCLEDPEAGLPSGNYVLYVLTELDPGSGGDRQFMSV